MRCRAEPRLALQEQDMTRKEPDPAESFRNLVTEWERGFDSLANRLMGTEEFSRSMNQFQNLLQSVYL